MRRDTLSLWNKVRLIAIIAFALTPLVHVQAAEGEVILRANVVERQSWNTINDFDYSNVSVDTVGESGEVKGISSQKNTTERCLNLAFHFLLRWLF